MELCTTSTACVTWWSVIHIADVDGTESWTGRGRHKESSRREKSRCGQSKIFLYIFSYFVMIIVLLLLLCKVELGVMFVDMSLFRTRSKMVNEFLNYWFWKVRLNFQFKGIVSDSNNIFLWHETEDINKKMIISKISVDSNFTFTNCAWLCALVLLHWLLY